MQHKTISKYQSPRFNQNHNPAWGSSVSQQANPRNSHSDLARNRTVQAMRAINTEEKINSSENRIESNRMVPVDEREVDVSLSRNWCFSLQFRVRLRIANPCGTRRKRSRVRGRGSSSDE